MENCKCENCKNSGEACERCCDNPKFKDVPKQSQFMRYRPTCPRGYTDCISDPAYIRYIYPKWYKELYGDKTPEEVSKTKCDIKGECYGDYDCYDDEDK